MLPQRTNCMLNVRLGDESLLQDTFLLHGEQLRISCPLDWRQRIPKRLEAHLERFDVLLALLVRFATMMTVVGANPVLQSSYQNVNR